MTEDSLGLGIYTVKTRVAPALLAAAPALALGLATLPLLPGLQRLWSLLAAGLTSFAALVARAAGNKIQGKLFDHWDGMPTTSRLRYRDNASASEVSRRHRDVERVLGGGLRLHTEDEERQDPVAADGEYQAAMKRVTGRVRDDPSYPLLRFENRSYSYARNLYGLRNLGVALAIGVLVVCLVGIAVGQINRWPTMIPLLAPVSVAVIALFLWPRVNPNYVRPSADAYADRVIEALEQMPSQQV